MRCDGLVAEVADWAAGLEEVHAQIAGAFARAEPRARALAYLRGLLGQLERKNGWTLAEAALDAGRGCRRGVSRWDAAAAADGGLERRRGPRPAAELCGRAARPGRGADRGRDRVRQEGQPLGRGGPAVH